MSCRLIFIRHGQSLGNLVDTFLGQTDLDLSETGYKQADAVSEYLSKENIDIIYSSDLLRAYNTSVPLCTKKGMTAVITKELREIFVGEWENRSFQYLFDNFGDSYKFWLNDIGNAKPDGGETVIELFDRVTSKINDIAKENDGKTVAVFTHATPIRALFTYFAGKSVYDMKDLKWATNASISEAIYSDGKFEIINYDFSKHLKGLETALPDLA